MKRITPATTHHHLRGSHLCAQLRPLAAQVRQQVAHAAEIQQQDERSDCPTRADLVADSESCTFEAFHALSRRAGLKKLALDLSRRDVQQQVIDSGRRLFLRELQGAGSNFGQWRGRMRRNAERGNPLPSQQNAWARWNEEQAEKPTPIDGLVEALLLDDQSAFSELED